MLVCAMYYKLCIVNIYSKGDSQKLAALRISVDKESYIKLANEEIPEVVTVPNTGVYDVSCIIGSCLVGIGILLVKTH